MVVKFSEGDPKSSVAGGYSTDMGKDNEVQFMHNLLLFNIQGEIKDLSFLGIQHVNYLFLTY